MFGLLVTLFIPPGTETAVAFLKESGMQDKVGAAADPAETALTIIKGGASRTREIYYPYFKISCLEIIPKV